VRFGSYLQEQNVRTLYPDTQWYIAASNAMVRTLLVRLWDPESIGGLDRTIMVNPAGKNVGCEFFSVLIDCN